MFPTKEKMPEEELNWAREFIKKSKWHEATTYRNTLPHEYTLFREVCRDNDKRLEYYHFLDLISDYGQWEKIFGTYGKLQKYLTIDGMRYFGWGGSEETWKDCAGHCNGNLYEIAKNLSCINRAKGLE